MAVGRMVHLVTVGDSFEAKLLAARLGSEGVLCELRGAVDGPYPLGPVHVYVEEDGLPAARELLAVPGAGDDDPPEPEEAPSRTARSLGWIAVALVVALVVLEVARVAGR